MAIRQGLLALLDEGPAYGYQLKAAFEERTGGTRVDRGEGVHCLKSSADWYARGPRPPARAAATASTLEYTHFTCG